MKNIRPRVSKEEYEFLLQFRKGNGRNVLAIGDLHEPFTLDGYLEFNLELANKYNITDVIFMGDIIDNHYSSYHETDADGLGGGDELEFAISKIAKWYEAFPRAIVIIGNHDRIIMRKAQTGSIPRKWIKSFNEVLEVPNWEFKESHEQDDVLYIHGEQGTARTRMKSDLHSVVQGHLHTQAYTEWLVGKNFKIFGCQVGSGIDRKSYAMAYAKHGKKPAIGSAVILDNGSLPFNCLMEL